MKILVTNDDGIYSPGIAELARLATRFGDVKIVAPDVEQSSVSHAITHARPLFLKSSNIKFENIEAFRVNGTPADCVSLGTHLDSNTEVVLSGINYGFNIGNAIWHSGTLAAAKQAVLLGIKGIACSTLAGKKEPDFERMSDYLEKTLFQLINHTEFGLYNVNIPPEPKGICWTRQSVQFYDGRIVPGMDPMGRKHYWHTIVPLEPAEEGTDRWAVEQGYISITPLRLDLTNEAALSKQLK